VKNNLIREIKTLVLSKSVWIGMAIMLLLCGIQLKNAIEYTGQDIESIREIYDLVDDDVDVEELSIQESEYYEVYSNENSFNNSYALIIGIGLIVFPIVLSIYVGSEYSYGTIRLKAASSSLVSVLVSKIVTSFCFVSVYLLLYGIVMKVWQNYCTDKYLFGDYERTNVIKYGMFDFLKLYLTALSVVFFASLCAILFTVIFKSTIAGIIVTICINYLSIPNKYNIFYIFKSIIVKVFRIYDSSCFSFEVAESLQFSSINQDIIFVILYMIIVLTGIYVFGKLQRN